MLGKMSSQCEEAQEASVRKENTEGRTKEDIKALTWDLNDANNQAWHEAFLLF